jgi:Rrf2 family protein
MFIVSKRTQYSLRALYHLSRVYGGTWVTTSRISEKEGIPKKFLEAILIDLKTHGFVNSKPGPGGGHQLARPPGQIGLGSAVRAIDGPLSLLPCANEMTHRTCSDCVDADDCGTRFVMQRVMKATARILDELTLADVCDLSRLTLPLPPLKLHSREIC